MPSARRKRVLDHFRRIGRTRIEGVPLRPIQQTKETAKPRHAIHHATGTDFVKDRSTKPSTIRRIAKAKEVLRAV